MNMEPVANRDFLLAFIASNNNNFYNGINDININYYVYNNVINNYHYYMNHQNFQAGAAAVAASALETFERLGIDVCKVAEEQAEEQDKSAEHSCEDAWSCSICQINEQEEEKEEEKEEVNEIVKTKCKHVFHSKCLAKWVVIKTTCPVCRASLIMKIT
jgi:hypothetical protein